MDRMDYAMQQPMGEEGHAHGPGPARTQPQTHAQGPPLQPQGCPFFRAEHAGPHPYPAGHPRVHPPSTLPHPLHPYGLGNLNQDSSMHMSHPSSSRGNPEQTANTASNNSSSNIPHHLLFDQSLPLNPSQSPWNPAPVSDFSWPPVSSSSSSSQPQPPRLHSHSHSHSFSSAMSHSQPLSSNGHSRTPSGYSHHYSTFARQTEPSGPFSSYSFDAPTNSSFQPGATQAGASGFLGGFPASGTFTPPQRFPALSSSHQQSQNQNFRQPGQPSQPTGVPSGPRNFSFDRDPSQLSFARNHHTTHRGSGLARGHLSRGPLSRNSAHRSSFNRPSSSRSPPHRLPAMSTQDPRAESVDTAMTSSGESSPTGSLSTPAASGPSPPSVPNPTSAPTTTTRAPPPAPTSNPNPPPPAGPTREAYAPPVTMPRTRPPPTGQPNWGTPGAGDRLTVTRHIARSEILAAHLGSGMPSDDSDDDDYNPDEEDDEETLRYILNAESGNLRGYQMLRGQLDASKRVATKRAIRELQSVQIADLPEKERTCVICYNDFGVESPEGINEEPLRLPKCKHVFGDHCIKKWFKESDSCPYCRDKLQSEIVLPAGSNAMIDLIRRERITRPEFSSMGYPPRQPGASQAIPTSFERGAATRSETSPPRSGWPQTGERRSPPSEASENSRRTRPRHSESTVFGSGGVPYHPPTSGSAHPIQGSSQLRPQSGPPPVIQGMGNSLNGPGRAVEYPAPPAFGPFSGMNQQRPGMPNPDGHGFYIPPPLQQSMVPTPPAFGNGRRVHAPVVNGSTRASPLTPQVAESSTSTPTNLSNPPTSSTNLATSNPPNSLYP